MGDAEQRLQRLPLFPLNTVVLPGLLVPLHVFEDRYRALVRDLVDQPDGPRRFGIVAIREGWEVGAEGVRSARHLHEVGCVVGLREVQAHADGRFDIVAAASARFRLLELHAPAPYLTADVAVLPETVDAQAQVLAPSVGRLFRRYRETLRGARGEQRDSGTPELPTDPVVVSYLVTAGLLASAWEKQALLAAPTVAARLELGRDLLRRELQVLRVLPSLPATDFVHPPPAPN